MLPCAVFMKHLTWSLASCRDRPLQITNNVRVQLAYQITDVTRPQTHRVVCLWAHHVHADALRADARWIPACSEKSSRWNRRGSAGRIETSKLGSRGLASNAQVWESYVFPCAVIVPVRHLSHGKKCNLQSDETANNMLDSIAAVTRNGIDNKLLHLRAYSLTKTLT